MNPFIQRRMIVWTLVLVAVLGVGVAFTVLQPPNLETSRRSVAGARLPASAVPDPAPEPVAADDGATATAVDFILECGAFSKSVSHSIRQIRFSGRYCEKRAPHIGAKSSSVRNRSNGFVGTVFYPDSLGFTTDYISVNAGENSISVEHVFTDGTTEARELHIQREPASEAP